MTAALVAAACATSNGTVTQAESNTLTQSERAGGWKLLFDGRSTAGWRNYRKETVGPGWTVVDGILTRSGEGAGDIITLDKFRNFDLVLDWRVAPGGNSGIFYRGTEEGSYIWQSAPEMQVLDDERHADGKSPLTSAGSVFALYEAPRGVVKPAGEWNTARVLVNGNRVEHWLNGKKVLEFQLGSDVVKAGLAQSKFKALPDFGTKIKGHIMLTYHADE